MAVTVTDPKEKDILLRTFASNIQKRSLKEFAHKRGAGDDFMRIFFKESLLDDPYMALDELGINGEEFPDNQVLLNADPPAAPVEENLYLDFDEFYGYLLTVVGRRVKENPEEKEEYFKLLAEVKTALGLDD